MKNNTEKNGISYPSVGTVSRKCYFTEGNAKNGIKHLPKFLREQVEIVKYVPENFQKEKLPLFENQ